MSFKQTDIISIFNSRKTLIEICNNNNYNTDEYENFNINEVEAMAKNNQLDMLLKTSLDKKVYIKYMLARFQFNDLSNLIEDLFELEGVLTKNETLVVIVSDEPNDSLKTKLCHMYDTRGIFVVVHNIKRLQKNILKHSLVPKHTIVYDDSLGMLDIIKQKYNLKSFSQLPEISRFDPVALLIGLRPGQVCKIERSSTTAVESEYYRVCV